MSNVCLSLIKRTFLRSPNNDRSNWTVQPLPIFAEPTVFVHSHFRQFTSETQPRLTCQGEVLVTYSFISRYWDSRDWWNQDSLVWRSSAVLSNKSNMGNLCSKSANEADNFSTPGRVLGNAPPKTTSAPVPQKLMTSTPGRTLGTGEGSTSPGDARSAAAKAAEVCHDISDNGFPTKWDKTVLDCCC